VVALAVVLPLIIVAPMLVLASALGTHAIIFPRARRLRWGSGSSLGRLDGLALAGARTAAAVRGSRRRDRERRPAHVVAEICGVTFGLLALAVCDSRLAPAMSAAVLPIVFGIDD